MIWQRATCQSIALYVVEPVLPLLDDTAHQCMVRIATARHFLDAKRGIALPRGRMAHRDMQGLVVSAYVVHRALLNVVSRYLRRPASTLCSVYGNGAR